MLGFCCRRNKELYLAPLLGDDQEIVVDQTTRNCAPELSGKERESWDLLIISSPIS